MSESNELSENNKASSPWTEVFSRDPEEQPFQLLPRAEEQKLSNTPAEQLHCE